MFIAVEGGDGAGKTGVVAALANAFPRTRMLVTREPGGTPEGLALRGLLLSASGPDWQPEAELLLMMAARVQHVAKVIRPALQAGTLVICDRFIGSTIAYQGGGSSVSTALIERLHRETTGDLWPSLTLLLDLDPELGLARSRARLATSGADETRFESRNLAFHQRVRAAYLAQAEADAGWRVLDASQSIADVQRSAIEAVRSHWPLGREM